jgi:hypothetical protein
LMAGAQAGAIVTVEILVEQDVVFPVRAMPCRVAGTFGVVLTASSDANTVSSFIPESELDEVLSQCLGSSLAGVSPLASVSSMYPITRHANALQR